MNVSTGGNEDETISSRAARASLAHKKWGEVLSAFLDKFQPDHGAGACAGDVERANEVIKVEDSSGVFTK